MAQGLDANVDCTAHAACLYEHGYRFAARYLKRVGQPLTAREAAALAHAGLSIVSIVELGFPTSVDYFTRARGEEDGRWAWSYAHHDLSQPYGSALYFTVDYDASPADAQGPIRAYFEGVLHAFEEESGGHPGYTVGVYGSGMVCRLLKEHLPIGYTWLAMSRGWHESRTYRGWSIRQNTSAAVCGIEVDTDESKGHGGGWLP
jgi:Domain of unknown function (DUF1906)